MIICNIGMINRTEIHRQELPDLIPVLNHWSGDPWTSLLRAVEKSKFGKKSFIGSRKRKITKVSKKVRTFRKSDMDWSPNWCMCPGNSDLIPINILVCSVCCDMFHDELVSREYIKLHLCDTKWIFWWFAIEWLRIRGQLNSATTSNNNDTWPIKIEHVCCTSCDNLCALFKYNY